MRGFIANIEKESLENTNFRKVLFTGPHEQLVVMSLKSGEDIGEEVHPTVDQFIRIEEGAGKAILAGETTAIASGSVVIIPRGVRHNIVNTGNVAMKIYTLYAPPNHPPGTVHRTKADAERAEQAEHAT